MCISILPCTYVCVPQGCLGPWGTEEVGSPGTVAADGSVSLYMEAGDQPALLHLSRLSSRELLHLKSVNRVAGERDLNKAVIKNKNHGPARWLSVKKEHLLPRLRTQVRPQEPIKKTNPASCFPQE